MATQDEQAPPSSALTTSGSMAGVGGRSADLGRDAADSPTEVARTRVSSPGRDAWRRFRRNWAAMSSLAVVLVLVIMAVFAPFMHTTNPLAQDYFALNQGPSAAHWFGTDGIGEDLYSRIVYGLRVPLMVGLIGTIITVAIGAFIGVFAGYFGGTIDSLLSRFTDLMFAFPAFLLALVIVSMFRQAPIFAGVGRVFLLVAVFSAVSWPPLTRFVRGLSLSMKEQQFVEAARTAGSSNMKIIRRHLLPNMYGLMLVQASLIAVGIIYTETTLSIFGLGVPPPLPDLGQLLYDGTQTMGVNDAQVIFPAIVIAIMLLAFTFIGDGVRDAVDPRMNS